MPVISLGTCHVIEFIITDIRCEWSRRVDRRQAVRRAADRAGVLTWDRNLRRAHSGQSAGMVVAEALMIGGAGGEWLVDVSVI